MIIYENLLKVCWLHTEYLKPLFFPFILNGYEF